MGTAIQGVFGNGILGTATTGLVRIPALCANVTAAAMILELAFRALTELVRVCGFKPDPDGYITLAAKKIASIRPYAAKEAPVEQKEGGEKKDVKEGYISADTISLMKKAFALSVLSILSTEFVRVVGGKIPPIYNHVLTFFGPLRLTDESFADSVAAFFKR